VEYGLDATGLDIAPTAVAEARALYPHLRSVRVGICLIAAEMRGAFDVCAGAHLHERIAAVDAG